MNTTENGQPLGLGLGEGLGPLRELATEGAALHSQGQPERMICDGLLAALDEVERLRADLASAQETNRKLAPRALLPTAREKVSNEEKQRIISALLAMAIKAHREQNYLRENACQGAAALVNQC